MSPKNRHAVRSLAAIGSPASRLRNVLWRELLSGFMGAGLCVTLLAAVSGYGCHDSSTAATPALTASPAPAPVTQVQGTSAQNPASAEQASEHEPFQGERAMALLRKQCDFGPRTFGTAAHDKCRDYLLSEMKQLADNTITQEFEYRGMKGTNIVGVFNPAGSKVPSAHPILLMAHWDTRPIADGPFSTEIRRGQPFRYGPNGWNRTTPIMGANDGASGVAILLELARMFKQKRPAVGVLLLLDDAEDYGDFTANNNQGDGVELGARYFAKNYGKTKEFGKPLYGILLDMVGAKNAFFPREAYSQENAMGTNAKFFSAAKSLGYGNVFRWDEEQSVGDDHVSINEAGIPTIDIIHPLPYGQYQTTGYTFWHTLQDTPDKCSAETLKVVGDTVAEVLYRETPLK